MNKSSQEIFDAVVVGAGAGGSVIAERLSYLGKSVLILDEGRNIAVSELKNSISHLMADTYRNSGAIPFFGPFTFPYGESRVLGGGTFINGGLLWRTPRRTLERWKNSIPDSVFSSHTWHQTEIKVENDLGVSVFSDNFSEKNQGSKILKETSESLGWKIVPVPRAVIGCQNLNRCAAGCPSGAKQDVRFNYLKKATKNGSILLESCKALKIDILNGKPRRLVYKKDNKHCNVLFKNLILSAGATQSPLILRKNGLSKSAGNYFEFHLNFRVLARFNRLLKSEKGTIFTHQVQEFEDKGILMMTTNFQFPYLLSALSFQPDHIARHFIEHYDSLGLFVSMTQPVVKAKIRSFMGQTYGIWSWDKNSFIQAKESIRLLCKMLFNAGATEVLLPIKNSEIFRTQVEVETCLAKCIEKNLQAVSVHGMGGCRMGNNHNLSIVDLEAKVWNTPNVFVVDSSTLPSNTGESPQGSIMTMAHEVVDRWITKNILQ